MRRRPVYGDMALCAHRKRFKSEPIEGANGATDRNVDHCSSGGLYAAGLSLVFRWYVAGILLVFRGIFAESFCFLRCYFIRTGWKKHSAVVVAASGRCDAKSKQMKRKRAQSQKAQRSTRVCRGLAQTRQERRWREKAGHEQFGCSAP